jgi:hypothetical protein
MFHLNLIKIEFQLE